MSDLNHSQRVRRALIIVVGVNIVYIMLIVLVYLIVSIESLSGLKVEHDFGLAVTVVFALAPVMLLLDLVTWLAAKHKGL